LRRESKGLSMSVRTGKPLARRGIPPSPLHQIGTLQALEPFGLAAFSRFLTVPLPLIRICSPKCEKRSLNHQAVIATLTFGDSQRAVLCLAVGLKLQSCPIRPWLRVQSARYPGAQPATVSHSFRRFFRRMVR